MSKFLLDAIALSFASGLGARGYCRLLDVFGCAEEVFCHSPAELQFRTGLKSSQVENISAENLRPLAETELEKLSRLGGKALPLFEADYPQLLKEINDPPPVLYAQGNVSLLNKTGVGIVGSRASTSYGRRIATRLGRELAAGGVTVISGLALGIDAYAHEGALAAKGNTVAVLGCGLDVVYPWQNRNLYEKIKADGLLLTEYPLGTRPDGFRFPARNRIIAGSARGIVVVEATRKSGSLITAQLALDFNRDVFAVPGQIDSVKSEGTHWLLQQGAKLVRGGSDIFEELQLYPGTAMVRESDKVNSRITGEGQRLLAMLDSYPVSKEELLQKLGMSAAEFSELILMLELDDLIEVLPGDLVRRL